MYGLLMVVIKEFLQLRQDKKMIPIMIAGPLAQLLALGYAANMDVNDIPMVLVDQDRTPESRRLVERFTGSGYFHLVGSEDTVLAVEPWLVGGRAQVAIVVAAGYGKAVAGGAVPRVQGVADGTDANSAVLGLGYAARIVAEAGAELVRARLGSAGRARVELVPRVW